MRKWKRIIRHTLGEKVLSNDENKESGNKRGNKKGAMVDEGIMMEEGEIQEREQGLMLIKMS